MVLLAGWPGTGVASAEVITRISDVRTLPRLEAAKALPVRLRGVVTWTDHVNHFTVQDESAGIWVNGQEAKNQGLWATDPAIVRNVHEGLEVEIEGVTHAGGYVPVVVPRTLTILGEKNLPPARAVDYRRLFAGAEANQRIELPAVVKSYRRWDGGKAWLLTLDAMPGEILAEVARAIVEHPEDLIDAEVRMRGVAASRFNTRGELIGIRLLSGLAGDVVVEKPAPAPESVPLVPLAALNPFSVEPPIPHRVRAHGTVTYVAAGKFLYLQEAESAVRVELASAHGLVAGDRVEVCGFVEMYRHVGELVGTTVRKIGVAEVPAAISIRPEEVITRNAAAASRGMSAQPHDFDGHLIRFRARLLRLQSAPKGGSPFRRLTLEEGSLILTATLESGGGQSFDPLLPGSELEVTGISQLEYAKGSGPGQTTLAVGMDVLLRSPADVVVVHAPSWWTAGRLLGLVATVLVVLGGTLLWVWQLHRQVAKQSLQLAKEMRTRRDAAVEFEATLRERNRLAANLHDTLLQTVSGLNYQLRACETESLPLVERKLNHLGTARRMVTRAQEDLRGTVWALRVLPLQERSIVEALQSLAAQLAEGRDVKITVSMDGALPRMSQFVVGNLLLVAQEAMHNALKHAGPSRIEAQVAVRKDGQGITLSVRDDGDGFTPDAKAGPACGHFGLAGMQERIERLGGKLRIESAPGQGTRVIAEVPLRPFDEEII